MAHRDALRRSFPRSQQFGARSGNRSAGSDIEKSQRRSERIRGDRFRTDTITPCRLARRLFAPILARQHDDAFAKADFERARIFKELIEGLSEE